MLLVILERPGEVVAHTALKRLGGVAQAERREEELEKA
jgi:hypothetical protein